MPRGPSRRCTGVGVPLLALSSLAFSAPPVWAEESATVITIPKETKVMEAIRDALPLVETFDLLTGVVVLEFEEGWSAVDPDLECVHVSPELDLTVRVTNRDEGDLTGEGPINVTLPGFVVKPESGDGRGAVRLQDVDLNGFCVQPPDSDGVISRARLVVSGDREVTLIDVGITNEDDDSVINRSYGLFAASGVITAYNLYAAGFSTGFAVKLTDATVDFTQMGGSYTGNTWGALGSFGATVTLTDVSFVDNQLVDRGLVGTSWSSDGGSIYAEGGTLSLSGVDFSNDWAPQHGGAIALQSVESFTGCGLSFVGSAAEGYGGAIDAVHSPVILDAGSDGACGPNEFRQVSAPLGAAMSLSQDGDGDLINAQLSWLELSEVSGQSAISSSLAGTLTLTDVSTPGGLGPAGLLHADGDSNPKIGAITAARLDVRGSGEPVPDTHPLIGVENTSLTLTESTFCGLVAGATAVSMISITDPIGVSLLQRNTIWGGWSDTSGSALISAQRSATSDGDSPTLQVIDSTLIGQEAERGVMTDERVTYWGVNNLFNELAVGHALGGEVEKLSHNLYGVTVYAPLIGNGEDIAAHELVGESPELVSSLADSCDDLPLLRPTSPAVGAGPSDPDSDLAGFNEQLTYNGVPYNSLDDIGAQPVEPLDPDEDLDPDGDGALTNTVYAGGRAGCGVAPRPLGLLGVVLAFAFTRRLHPTSRDPHLSGIMRAVRRWAPRERR